MDISKGRYWTKPWSLVDGCTPCSPGCEHCWSMAMGKRFHKWPDKVTIRPDRLDIPLRTRKPTVFAVWNDLFHEDVPDEFIKMVCAEMYERKEHTFLVLTKRALRMSLFFQHDYSFLSDPENIYFGLTVCNQAEFDAKIGDFLRVPGKKFISYEPALGPVKFETLTGNYRDDKERNTRVLERYIDGICCVILGGESGHGARPLHPDWVRSVRDQCEAAGTDFFFKQWGEWIPISQQGNGYDPGCSDYPGYAKAERCVLQLNGEVIDAWPKGAMLMRRVGHKAAGRLLDGREWNELPWKEDEHGNT